MSIWNPFNGIKIVVYLVILSQFATKRFSLPIWDIVLNIFFTVSNSLLFDGECNDPFCSTTIDMFAFIVSLFL